jgi:hypothetical protein
MGLSPSFIFAQRMVVGENLYVPLVLGAWYLAVKNKHWALIVGLCVLAGLSKITGLIGVPLLAYYYLTNKQWQKAAIFVAASLGIFLAIYIPYGWLIDWDQFLNMNVRQSFRLLGWGNPAFIFSHPGFHMRSLLDASYYLILFAGMLPVMLFTKGGKIPQVLIAAIFAGIALIWVTSTEQDMLGWYKIFLFSVLSIAAGSLALFKAQIPWLLLWGVAIVNNLNLVRYAQSPYPDHQLVRLAISGLIGVMLLLLLLENKLQKKIIPVLIGILLIANIAVSAYVTDKYFEAFCFDIHCPIPRVTLKSFLGL